MHLKKLLALLLVSASLLSITACGRKEVVSIEIPKPSVTVLETVKPAEPVVVSVEPINEVKEEVEAMMPDSDLDYYGKVETEKNSYTTGLPTISEDTSSATTSAFPEDNLTPEAEALFGETWHVTYFEGGTW